VAFEEPRISYTGKISKVDLGRGDRAVGVGGAEVYPLHVFEGKIPSPPRIAFEVSDAGGKDWPSAVIEPYREVRDNPVAWARKAIDAYGAEMIALHLDSTDPNGLDRPAEEAARTAEAVCVAISVPLIVLGTGNEEKDTETLRRVCELCQGANLAVGPVKEGNYKKIGAAAIAYGHTVVASTPIDVNLAKQLNILLENLGVPAGKIVMDPTTGGLGYGIEYTYSVMERDRMAGLVQQDTKLQIPIICDMAREVWKTKEAQSSAEEMPELGEPRMRGIAMETTTAILLLAAGADILVMRHPEAVKIVREISAGLLGGQA